MIHDRDARERERERSRDIYMHHAHSVLKMFFVRITLRRLPIRRPGKHVVFIRLKCGLSPRVSHGDVLHADGGVIAESIARHRRRVGEEVVPPFSVRT